MISSDAVPHGRTEDILRATTSVVEQLELEVVLRRIVEAAMSLVGARYGGLGVTRPDGTLERFLHVGISEEIEQEINRAPEGRGVLGAVVTEGAPIRLEHVSEDARWEGFPEGHPPMDSFLGVPIRVRGVVYGNLYLADSAEGRFSSDDEQLIVALAATAGAAIDNARLYDLATMRSSWTAALAEVLAALLDVRGDDALDVIAERIAPLIRADIVAVSVASADGRHLRIQTGWGRNAPELLGVVYPVHGSLGGRALEQQRAVRAESVDAHASFPGQPAVGPTVAIPLLAGEEMLGVLTVTRAPGDDPFTDAELEMAVMFAGQAGLALEVVRGREDHRRLELVRDRARIARDLHDHVIQRLFAAGLSLQSLTAAVDADVATSLAEQVDALDAAIGEIRTVIFALGAAQSDRVGLRSRVMAIAADFAALLPVAPRTRFRGPVDSLVTPSLADDVVAVVREALSNCARHADAQVVDLSIAVDERMLTVHISDDGRGMSGTLRRSGLANLTARAENRAGACSISDRTGGGTAIIWTVPLATAREEERA